MSTLASEVMFSSLAALRGEHRELQKTYRDENISTEILLRIEDFIRRGRATGAILDDEDDQAAAQALLDFWGTVLYRAGYVVPETTLCPFDRDAAPTLDDRLVPYVGLDSFVEGNKELFFGREELVASLVERLGHENLLAISGPSGSGKSSLVLAGIIPALKAGGVPGSAGWQYLGRMVPGSNPLENLAKLLQRRENNGFAPGTLAAEFLKRPEYLRELLRSSGCTTVLVVDQFEELSTLCDDATVREAFEKCLVSLSSAGDVTRHIVILTMRSDFIGAVARQPELQTLLETALVPVTPLSAAELREAITRPAERVGLKFEPGIVESLVHDILGEPAALPLLQFTLLKLWERRDHNRITAEEYRKLGGGRLALTRSADSFINSLIPEERVVAERILLRLVRPGIGQDNVASRIKKSLLYGIGPQENVDRVLDKLIGQHLVRLTVGQIDADSEVEVAHEAMVRNWQHLVTLLDTERDRMTTLRRLELKAGEWVRLGRGKAGLLSDAALAEAEQWMASPDSQALGASDDLRLLVSSSRRAVNAVRKRESVVKAVLLGLAGAALIFAVSAGWVGRELLKKEHQLRINENAYERYKENEASREVGKLKDLNKSLADGARLYDAHRLADKAERAIDQDPERASLIAVEAAAYLLKNAQGPDEEDEKILSETSQKNRVRVVLPGPWPRSTILAFSPDGLRLATAAANQPLRIWDAVTGEQIASLDDAKGATAIAFNYSGNQIAVAVGQRIQMFDTISWKATGESHSSSGIVRRLAFSPKGYVADIVSTGAVELWAPGSNVPKKLSDNGTEIAAITFDPTGEVIATGDKNGSVQTWDTETGNLMQILPAQAVSSVNDLVFSPAGNFIVVSRKDKGLQSVPATLKDIVLPNVQAMPERPSPTASASATPSTGQDFARVSYSADGQTLVSFEAAGGNVIIFEANERGPQGIIPVNLPGASVTFSLDGGRFAATSPGTPVKIWDIAPARGVNLSAPATNNASGVKTPGPIARAFASLTTPFRNANDCRNDSVEINPTIGKEICEPLQAAVSDIVEGNRLVKLRKRSEALAKFEAAHRKAPWLTIHDKEIQFIQDQTKDDASQRQKTGPSAQKLAMDRASGARAKAATGILFRSAAYQAARRDNEPLAREWLKRGLAVDPRPKASSKDGDHDDLDAQRDELMAQGLGDEAKWMLFDGPKPRHDLPVVVIEKAVGYVEKARTYQSQIPLDADLFFTNGLCWEGSIREIALATNDEVIATCDRAVQLSHNSPNVRDSRGVNQARRGKFTSAIEDFQSYVNSRTTRPEAKEKRKLWISLLEKEKDPFTAEELLRMQHDGW
jgi:DNA-binding beta-propeller fold protein YncE